MFKLSEEVNRQLELAAPLITFFALPQKEQLAVLPVLNEEIKYDFPDGDLITSNALEVLINGYEARLNAISLRFVTMLDESSNENIENLATC